MYCPSCHYVDSGPQRPCPRCGLSQTPAPHYPLAYPPPQSASSQQQQFYWSGYPQTPTPPYQLQYPPQPQYYPPQPQYYPQPQYSPQPQYQPHPQYYQPQPPTLQPPLPVQLPLPPGPPPTQPPLPLQSPLPPGPPTQPPPPRGRPPIQSTDLAPSVLERLKKETPGFSSGHHAADQDDADKIAQSNKSKPIHSIVDSNYLPAVADGIATALVRKFGKDLQKCKYSTFSKNSTYYVDINPGVPGWVLRQGRMQSVRIVQYEIKNLNFTLSTDAAKLTGIHAVPLDHKAGDPI